LFVLMAALCVHAFAQVPPGVRVSTWSGFPRIDFDLLGHHAAIVGPKTPATGTPWIWRTESLEGDTRVDLALLERGWHVAYFEAPGLYGSPKSVALLGRFYAHVVAQYGLADRMVLEGIGAGGLDALSFAATHPTRVAALYLNGPAVDIRSWPGRSPASTEWRECLEAYNLTPEKVATFKGSPLDRIAAAAVAKVPIVVAASQTDETVSFAENTGALEKQYRALGGPIEVVLKPGTDRLARGAVDPAPIVEFLLARARM
jgi:pimeloyl-ACP methyl ester carboxylesterase